MAAPLPPNLSLQQLTQAQRALESALGAGKVFFEDLDRTSYQDKFAVDDAAHLPAGAIAPTTVEEVQAALRIANQFRVPIWPISRGKNLGYGGSAPLLGGSVVMDLSRMKRIEFDEEFGTVLLEPGVGFYDLYDFIQANKLPYWLSTPGNSWGSVIGNALDRGVGHVARDPLRAFGRLARAIERDHPRTGRQQCLGRRFAEPRVAARDKGDFACRIHGLSRPRLPRDFNGRYF